MGFLSVGKILGEEHPQKKLILCGMDEAGRGPWAGPVVAAAVVFKKRIQITGLKNSKKLTAEKREKIYRKLIEKTAFGVGLGSVEEIDKLGLIKATNLAFTRAFEDMVSKEISEQPSHILIDGRDKFSLPVSHTSVIKGDEKVRIIACASVIAKVERDRIMTGLAKKYPNYGFEFHKGYGTKRHQSALEKFGACQIHRQSFKPVQVVIQK